MEYVYIALLLHKLGKEINEANVKKIAEAAGASVDEAKIKGLIASLQGVDIEKVLSEAATMPVAGIAGATPKTEKAEEKKEKEKSAEEAAEGLAALFG